MHPFRGMLNRNAIERIADAARLDGSRVPRASFTPVRPLATGLRYASASASGLLLSSTSLPAFLLRRSVAGCLACNRYPSLAPRTRVMKSKGLMRFRVQDNWLQLRIHCSSALYHPVAHHWWCSGALVLSELLPLWPLARRAPDFAFYLRFSC
jgi:hypothetical protein